MSSTKNIVTHTDIIPSFQGVDKTLKQEIPFLPTSTILINGSISSNERLGSIVTRL